MTLSDLEQELISAQKQLQTAQENFKTGNSVDTLHRAIEAQDAVVAAQRALAAAKGEEHAVPYDIGVRPEAAVTGPVVLQADHAVVLTFNAMRLMPDGYFHDAGCAIVDFELCCLTKFGLPNDEALEGHPLYAKGLNGYGVYEVMNSSWIYQVTEMNRIAFPNSSEWIATKRHFLFVFHNNSFECIAKGMRVSVSNDPYKQIFAGVAVRVLGHDA